MRATSTRTRLKSREPRRRVLLKARLRTRAGWGDACILNVSPGGLMIHSNRPASQGSTIELWHGELMIVADVVWRNGLRAGLRAQDPVPVEDIVTLAQSSTLQPTASWPAEDRRKRLRTHDDSRLRSRAIEFASIAAVSAVLATAGFSMVEQALAEPIAVVEAAIRG